ncbi:hypothetical protein BLA15816_04691 [Burkholderia lata]|nr:hypothetical protein BLA15816_04691 [Burkholderia lata]
MCQRVDTPQLPRPLICLFELSFGHPRDTNPTLGDWDIWNVGAWQQKREFTAI